MTTYCPKNMLVTGGAGFIGSHFVRYMLKKDNTIKIFNLDSLNHGGLENLSNLFRPKDHTFIEGDISDIDLVHTLFKDYNIDTVVHFAAESHVDRSIISPGAFVLTNIVGTFNLLETARLHWLENKKLSEKECRFFHISTDEVFGSLSKEDKSFHENSPYKPNSPYSASKASSDHLVHCYQNTYGLPTHITNCSNNYGPMQHPEKFIPTIIRSCLAWEPIPIYGKGDQIRDWLYVEDHCRAIDLVLTQGIIGERYNIGGNNEQVNLDVVKKVCRIMDELLPQEKPYESLISFTVDRPGHDYRYAVDCSKIKHDLGWEPTTSFETGLLTTVQDYLVIR